MSIYDAAREGPDISGIDPAERCFWVLANSVHSRDPVLQQVTLHELYTMWDYEGKLATKGWTDTDQRAVLRAQLLSPPGKVLRAFGYVAVDTLLAETAKKSPAAALPAATITLGFTCDVPVTRMEQNISTRAGAAMPDDAEVDLTTWGLPGETDEEARARQILRHLAVKWWA